MKDLYERVKREMEIIENYAEDPEELGELKWETKAMLRLADTIEIDEVGVSLVERLLKLMHGYPLTPLTGDDDEWEEAPFRFQEKGEGLSRFFINKRYHYLHKTVYDDGAIVIKDMLKKIYIHDFPYLPEYKL